MIGEISYDLVMEEDMQFVEGTYRIGGGDWRVFIVKKAPIPQSEVAPCQWESGVAGVTITMDESIRLNKRVVEEVLMAWLGVEKWNEVRGPDSMDLR
jgi:hypothetical protein